jgi:tetratricopeptide (TPR) repeat protein
VTPTEFVMDGDFNIAVAGLALPANATETAAQAFTYVHQSIYQSLINEYMNSGVQVERQRYGTVEIEREAEILAQRMNADLVIYANVESFGNTHRYTPRFVLAARQDVDMGEIVGDHTWLQETLTNEALNALANSGSAESARLRLKSTILTEFTQAIVSLSSGDPVGARDPIARAVRASETFRERYPEEIPISVIYLFASTIYRMNGDLDQAERYAGLAAEDPDYGRARLALGNVQYVRGIRAYYDENDRASAFNYLNRASQHYLDALALANQPLSALVPEKAYISLGNTYQVLYQIVDANARPRFLDDAIAAYQTALRRLSAIRSAWLQPSVQDWSSEAERQLGSMYDVAGLTAEAAAAYERALALSQDPTFEAVVGATLDSLNSPDAATPTP